MTQVSRPLSRRGFSLIELLIVILIITLVIAIVLPALGATRKAARKMASTELMNNIQQACEAFQLSERRLPGYFSAREMGDMQNATYGFTGMENVMLDLAGGIAPGTGTYGPTPSHQINYDPSLVGVAQAGSKVYFTPPAKNFKKQDGVEGGTKVASPLHINWIPDMIDAEGTPLLMWMADSMAIQPVALQSDFAQVQSGNATGPARFYWNSNSAFLSSTQAGSKGINETTNSLLSSTSPTRQLSLLGLLGNPSSPNNVTNVGPALLLPTAPRGAFVIQSAGSDGVYVGKDERGGKVATGGVLTYDLNFRSSPSSDIMADFDDIIVSGG